LSADNELSNAQVTAVTPKLLIIQHHYMTFCILTNLIRWYYRGKWLQIVFVCSSDGPNVEETEVTNSKS